MKRILIFNDSLEMGGTEMLLVNLLDHLTKEGCRVTLLLPIKSEKNSLIDRIPPSVTMLYLYEEGISRWKQKIEENIMIFWPTVFRKMKGIRDADYDVAVCFKDSFYARIFSKMKTLNILWIHNILYRRSYEVRSMKERMAVWLNKKHISITQKCYTKFDKVVCVSDTCRNVYLDIIYENKKVSQIIEIVYNAIDLSKIKEKSHEKIEDLPQGITKFVLVTRDSPDKRVDRLFSAVARLIDEKYEFEVYIIGDLKYYHEDVNKSGLQHCIHLLGRIENPHPYVLQSNWALCVSERESFSLTLLEAMALQTPVITTNCGGPTDIVDGGKYGILVANSSQGVYEGMKMVMDDATLSVKYSSNLNTALNRFNYAGWLNNIDQILELDQ